MPQVHMYLSGESGDGEMVRCEDMKSALAIIDRKKMHAAAAEKRGKRDGGAQNERSGKG